jgi:acetate kinase
LLSRWPPVSLSASLNEANETLIHDDESLIRVLRIETDENGYMARAATRLIG